MLQQTIIFDIQTIRFEIFLQTEKYKRQNRKLKKWSIDSEKTRH